MSRWFLAWTLMVPLACTPGNTGFGPGSHDDTAADDSGTGPTSDCPPTLGDITGNQDDMPGRGWVAEIHVPFTEGSCPIDDGLLFLEWTDEYGATHAEDPWTVGFKDEQTYVETYDDQTGVGSIYVVVVLPEEGYHFEFEVWMKFPDGSMSARASGVVN